MCVLCVHKYCKIHIHTYIHYVYQVASMINAVNAHVLVDMWAWSPLGRCVCMLDMYACIHSCIKKVLVGICG
jgi:hypothetical protein